MIDDKDPSLEGRESEYVRTTVEVLLVIAVFLLGTYFYGG